MDGCSLYVLSFAACVFLCAIWPFVLVLRSTLVLPLDLCSHQSLVQMFPILIQHMYPCVFVFSVHPDTSHVFSVWIIPENHLVVFTQWPLSCLSALSQFPRP